MVIDRRLAKVRGASAVRRLAGSLLMPASEEEQTLELLPKTLDIRSRNAELNEAFARSGEQATKINWFVPYHENPLYAGVYTILRFAARLATAHGIENRIVVYDRRESELLNLQQKIPALFPALQGKISATPQNDGLAIATFWKSAYVVSGTPAKARYYFVQDYEPLFYPAGTLYGLAENTYRLGLKCIVNTPGVLDHLRRVHGVENGVSFVPTVDRSVFFEDRSGLSNPGPVRIAFYGRPSHPRNGFHLGIESLRRVKERYGDRVRIVSAGDDWNVSHYGLAGVVENLGRLPSISAVAQLYRTSDIGLFFMFSKHPSYQPFEMMASGCAVVSNENEATAWFLRHEHNCLLTPPTVEEVAESLGRLVEDVGLRQHIQSAASSSLPVMGWDDLIDDTCRRAGLIR